MHKPFSLVFLAAAAASAQATSKMLLISGPNFLKSVTDNGTFQLVNSADVGPRKTISWLTPDFEQNRFFGNDERNPDTTMYTFNSTTGAIGKGPATEGPDGIVNFELSPKKDILVGAGYASNMIAVFSRNATGIGKPIEIPVSDKASVAYPTMVNAGARPHQIVFAPSGNFIVVPLLGSDELLVINAQDPKLPKINHHPVPTGCGPRHGVFWKPEIPEEDVAMHFVLVCEQSNTVITFQIIETATTMHFSQVQAISTFAEGSYPKDANKAFASEIVLAKRKDQPTLADVYVSNRFTGTEDSIACFELKYDSGLAILQHKQAIKTNGTVPRSISFDEDETTLFVANMGEGKALVAFPRDPATGALDEAKKVTVDRAVLGLKETDGGPQFVMQWPSKTK